MDKKTKILIEVLIILVLCGPIVYNFIKNQTKKMKKNM